LLNPRRNRTVRKSLRFESLEDRSLFAAGVLDATFGQGGSVVTDFGNNEFARIVALQSNGNIVVAVGGSADFALVRYNADGTLDDTFGDGGRVVTDFSGSQGGCSGVAIQTDGKIVAAGSRYVGGSNGSGDFALARYNLDGSLDTMFGNGGKVITDFGGYDDFASGLVLQSDGKIVVTGTSYNGSNNDFALARYNTDGSLDTSFDVDGKVTTDFGARGTYGDEVINIGLQHDGKIIVLGQLDNSLVIYSRIIAVARYNADGTLDTTFDSDGKVTTGFVSGPHHTIADIAVQSDGKIIVAGNYQENTAMLRLNVDGTLDRSFDGDGRVLTPNRDPLREADAFFSIALQSDGKIVLAGQSLDEATGKSDVFLTRYNTNGSVDTSFGVDGRVTTSFGDFVYASGRSVAVQSDGKIVVAGGIVPSGEPSGDFLLLRYEGDPILPPALSGDYNRSGAVDGADYVIWRKSQGMVVAAFSGADGTGDGTVDQHDYDLWKANFGQTLAAATSAALVAEPALAVAASDAPPAERSALLPLAAPARAQSMRPHSDSLRPPARRVFASAESHDHALLAWLAARPGGKPSEPFTTKQTDLSDRQDNDESALELDALQLAFASFVGSD
jgi:uncharacterized delta-60 repeat protein